VNRQAFELAEGTSGFGQLLLTGAGLVHGGGVEGWQASRHHIWVIERVL
jgi:hypothetical protein